LLGLDGCNNFLDLCFLLLQLFLLLWLFLDKVTMRWNIFNIERVAYLETWLKLECTSLSVDVELDLYNFYGCIFGDSNGIANRVVAPWQPLGLELLSLYPSSPSSS
jgi:hypothetical protein